MPSRTPPTSSRSPKQSPKSLSPSFRSPKPSPKSLSPRPSPKRPRSSPRSQSPKPPQKVRRPGKRLLSFDRGLGARFVAGADEAGRGSLAGPLVVAGVLLDYGALHDHRVPPLALLNDSKQLTTERR